MEVLMLHKNMSKAEAFEESVRMLDAVKKCRKRVNACEIKIRTNFLAACVSES